MPNQLLETLAQLLVPLDTSIEILQLHTTVWHVGVHKHKVFELLVCGASRQQSRRIIEQERHQNLQDNHAPVAFVLAAVVESVMHRNRLDARQHCRAVTAFRFTAREIGVGPVAELLLPLCFVGRIRFRLLQTNDRRIFFLDIIETRLLQHCYIKYNVVRTYIQ